MKCYCIDKTDYGKIKASLKSQWLEIEKRILNRLVEIGEKCVAIARERGSYGNQTGNLRSSIGYVILKDGEEVTKGASAQFSGPKGDGSDGIRMASLMPAKIQALYPMGIVLAVFAGMNYAVYVEAIHHKDVVTTAKLLMDKLVHQRLDEFLE